MRVEFLKKVTKNTLIENTLFREMLVHLWVWVASVHSTVYIILWQNRNPVFISNLNRKQQGKLTGHVNLQTIAIIMLLIIELMNCLYRRVTHHRHICKYICLFTAKSLTHLDFQECFSSLQQGSAGYPG